MSHEDELESFPSTVRKLREQVARLTSQNLALRKRVQELEAEKNEAGVEEVVQAVARSLRLAELAMAEASLGQQRYAISEIETTLRTFVAPRTEGLLLRLPDPEQNVQPGQLSSVQFTLVQAPQSTTE